MGEFLIESGARIGSVHLKVSNLEKSLQFYESFMGFKIVKRDATAVFLSPDGKYPYLVTLSQATSQDNFTKRAGLYHFAILLPERKHLAVFLSHLLKHKDKVKIDGFSDHLVSEALYIRDPDNIGIEIYRDRNPSEWKWNDNSVQMTTIPLDTDNLLRESDGAWKHFPDRTTVGHVHLHVSNLENAKRFYSDILGMANTANIQGASFFAAGKYHHHIATNTWLGEDIPNASAEVPGLEYFTIEFSDEGKFDDILNQLKSCQIPIRKMDDGLFSISDANNISIGLTVQQ